MKPREPNSISEAVTTLISGLGATASAEIVGKSPQLVHTWMDPDHGGCPTVRQAIALDSAFVARGLGEPPILALYAARLGSVVHPHQRMHPSLRLIHCFREMGDVTRVVMDATDPDSPGGTSLTATERSAIAKEAREAIRELERLVKDIEK